MEQNLTIYSDNISSNTIVLKVLKKKLFISYMIRLSIFVITGLLAYFFFGNTPIVIVSLIVGIGVFLFLVSKHTDLVKKKKYLEAIIEVNQDEIDGLNGNLSSFNNGVSYKDPLHHFSHDIDLFGENSFFHHINRTNRKESQSLLASMLSSNSIDNIKIWI